MITVTLLNKNQMIINAEHISHIEKTPNTVITLTTGNKIVINETPEEVVRKVIAYKKEIYAGMGTEIRNRENE